MGIVVSRTDAEEFLGWIDQKVQEIYRHFVAKRPHLVDLYHQSVIISFDKDYKPFIGFSKGYNHPESRNHYLPVPVPNLATQIKIILDSQRKWGLGGPPGGRVFVGVDSVFIRDSATGDPITLSDLTWEDDGALLVKYLQRWKEMWR